MSFLSEIYEWVSLDKATLLVIAFVSLQISSMFTMHSFTAKYHRSWHPLSKQRGTPYICWLFPLVRAVFFVGMNHWIYPRMTLGSFLILDVDENMALMPLVIYGMQILFSWILSFCFLTAKKLDDALLQLILMDTTAACCVLLSCWIDWEATYRTMERLFLVVHAAYRLWELFFQYFELRVLIRRWRLAGVSQRSLCSRQG